MAAVATAAAVAVATPTAVATPAIKPATTVVTPEPAPMIGIVMTLRPAGVTAVGSLARRPLTKRLLTIGDDFGRRAPTTTRLRRGPPLSRRCLLPHFEPPSEPTIGQCWDRMTEAYPPLVPKFDRRVKPPRGKAGAAAPRLERMVEHRGVSHRRWGASGADA